MIDISNTATTKRWDIRVSRADLFKIVSLQTSYINNRLPVRDDLRVLSEDDTAIYNTYLLNAVADLNVMLARYYQREFDEGEMDSDYIYLDLSLSLNAKDSIAFSLGKYIEQYLEKSILKEWYGADSYALGIDNLLAQYEARIKTTLNYRKTPTRLNINPLF